MNNLNNNNHKQQQLLCACTGLLVCGAGALLQVWRPWAAAGWALLLVALVDSQSSSANQQQAPTNTWIRRGHLLADRLLRNVEAAGVIAFWYARAD